MKLDSYFPENVIALFSEKSDGPCSASDPNSRDNLRRFLSGHAISELRLAVPTLVHSGIVEIVTGDNISRGLVCDALITAEPDVFLSVNSADCPALFLYDPDHRVIALAHCGWRGITLNIVHHVIRAMAANFNANPGKLMAWVSPGIRSCHFEVGEDVYNRLAPFLFGVVDHLVGVPKFIPGQRNTIDLSHTIIMQLIQNGLAATARNIRLAFECTYCQSNKYFSWRRDHAPERMIAVMGMRKSLTP